MAGLPLPSVLSSLGFYLAATSATCYPLVKDLASPVLISQVNLLVSQFSEYLLHI